APIFGVSVCVRVCARVTRITTGIKARTVIIVITGVAGGLGECDPDEAGAFRRPLTLEPSLVQPLAQRVGGACVLAANLAPDLPRRVDAGECRPADSRRHSTSFLEELAEHVLGAEVVIGRCADARRRTKPDLLPGEASVDHPPQDARPLGSELLRQGEIAF